MKSIAEQLCALIMPENFTDVFKTANELAVGSFQNLKEETTVFTFEDGSRLKFFGVEQTARIWG